MQPHSSKILAVSLALFSCTPYIQINTSWWLTPQLPPPPLPHPPSSFASELAFPSAVYSQPSSLADIVKAQHLVFHFFQRKIGIFIGLYVSSMRSCSMSSLRLHILPFSLLPFSSPSHTGLLISRTYQTHFCSREKFCSRVLMVPSSQSALLKP